MATLTSVRRSVRASILAQAGAVDGNAGFLETNGNGTQSQTGDTEMRTRQGSVYSQHEGRDRVPTERSGHNTEGLSINEQVGNIVCGSLGAGLLMLPFLMVKTGWVLGLAMILMVGFFMLEVARVFDDYTEAAAANNTPINSYEDAGRVAAGQNGVYVVRFSVTCMNFGILCGWVILVGLNMTAIFPPSDPELWYSDGPNNKMWTVILCPIFVALGQCTDLTIIAKLSVVGTIAAVGSVFAVIVQAINDSSYWKEWDSEDIARIHQPWPDDIGGIGFALAIMINSFSMINTFPIGKSQMRDKREFIIAFRKAFHICIAIFIAVAAVGHYGYGVFVQKTVVLSMKFTPGSPLEAFTLPYTHWTGPESRFIGTLMSALVNVNLFISFPIMFTCFVGQIEKSGIGGVALGTPGTPINRVLRLALCGLITMVSIVCPYFMEILGCFASICASLNNAMLIIIFAFMFEKVSALGVSVPRRCLHVTILATCVFAMLFGFSNASQKLMQELGGDPDIETHVTVEPE